jgi:hypothetical protein
MPQIFHSCWNVVKPTVFPSFQHKVMESISMNHTLKIRSELERRGLSVLVLGAARNVYPSRMSSQMSHGLKAYRLQMGKQAALSDLVDIFKPVNKDEVATVAEQKQYWVKSLSR